MRSFNSSNIASSSRLPWKTPTNSILLVRAEDNGVALEVMSPVARDGALTAPARTNGESASFWHSRSIASMKRSAFAGLSRAI